MCHQKRHHLRCLHLLLRFQHLAAFPPLHTAIPGHYLHFSILLQAPTHGGPYGQRKVYYIKDACGGSTGLPCVGEAYIISSYDFTPFRGNVSIDGTSVNWVSGHQFPTDGSWNGKGILINGSKNYTIASVTNATHLTLTSRHQQMGDHMDRGKFTI